MVVVMMLMIVVMMVVFLIVVVIMVMMIVVMVVVMVMMIVIVVVVAAAITHIDLHDRPFYLGLISPELRQSHEHHISAYSVSTIDIQCFHYSTSFHHSMFNIRTPCQSARHVRVIL